MLAAHLARAPWCGALGEGTSVQVLNIHERRVEEGVVVERLQEYKQCKNTTVFNTTLFFIMEPNLHGFLLSYVAHSIF